MAADWKLLLCVLMFQSLVLEALCCICAKPRPKDHFCTHEYVMKVLVKGANPYPYKNAFVIDVMKVFKGDATKLDLQFGHNGLLKMSPVCPLDFIKEGDMFLIFGSNVKGNIYTELCSGSMNWKYVKRTVRKNLYQNIYKTGCKCAKILGQTMLCKVEGKTLNSNLLHTA